METSREVRLELNCLTIRTEDSLIRWAVAAFELPSEVRSHTEYTADFTCGRIASHLEKTRNFYTVELRNAWLASRTIRRLLFREGGWRSQLGYRLMHDAGIAVHFGTEANAG